MTTTAVTTQPVTPTPPTADTGAAHGRNKITSKALRRVVSAVAADALGVTARQIGVDLADKDGELAVTATAAVRVGSLKPEHRDRAAAVPSIVARAATAQNVIRDRVNTITGSTIGEVNLRLNAAHIQEEGRVR